MKQLLLQILLAVYDHDALVVGTYTLTSDVVAYVALRFNSCLNAVDASCLVEYEEHRLNSVLLSLCPCTECGECTVAVPISDYAKELQPEVDRMEL